MPDLFIVINYLTTIKVLSINNDGKEEKLQICLVIYTTVFNFPINMRFAEVNFSSKLSGRTVI